MSADMCRTLFSWSAFDTLVVYIASAWIYGEVYRFSASSKANLHWVKPGRPSERASLNERPMYLHSFYFMLAIAQAYQHLGRDYGRILVPVGAPISEQDSKSTRGVVRTFDRFVGFLPHLVYRVGLTVGIAYLFCPLIYCAFLRPYIWQVTLYFTGFFWSFSRSSTAPKTLIAPLSTMLSFHVITSGIWLVALWQWTNMAFSTYLGQPPLKTGKPLTDGLRDANLSLINGLQAKHEVVRSFAFWELRLISQDFPARRQLVYADLDNNAWRDILNASRCIIEAVNTRIEAFENPSQLAPEPSAITEQVTTNTEKQESLQVKPLTEGNIFMDPPKPKDRPTRFESAFSNFARSHGQADDWTVNLRSRTQSFMNSASKSVLTPERKRKFITQAGEIRRLTFSTTEDNHSTEAPLTTQFLRSKVGSLFRQSYSNRIKKIVLGTPHSELTCFVDAVLSITHLTVESLKEDKYGIVQNDVAAIVKLFTATANRVHQFNSEDGLKIHWTDVCFPSRGSPEYETARKVGEVDTVLLVLKTGLNKILDAFKDHLADVGLTPKDVNLARQAAGMPQI